MSYKKDMSKYEHLEGWERCGFGEQLDKWAEKYGERTAVTDSEDEISYMELKQKADCLAAAFLRKGILKGDKVLVQLPNRISFVIVFFALSKIGAVPIMMLPAHREAELEGIIELAKPAAYIVVEKYLGFSYVPMANAMKEKYSCIRHIFVDSESGDISGMIAETCGENGAFPAVDGYETAVLLLSGGTTGVPKLIPRTHTDYLFDETVLENIRMGKPSATDEEVYQAARDCGCYDFILNLENGFHTVVGGAGGHLSGGERQRIAIARAVLKNAPIVILDEATAYIDAENEALIQEAMAKVIAGKTVLMIAHRLSTITDADKIVVIKDGQIIDEGTHENLLTSCTLYQEMWKAHMDTKDVA